MAKVIGIGDCVVDKYLPDQIMYPGGNALNFAVYAQMLGEDAAYLGTFAKDAVGMYIKQILTEKELDISRCNEIEGENSWAMVRLEQGDRVFVDGCDGIQKEHPLMLKTEMLDYVADFDLAHLGCYGFYEKDVLKKVKETGVKVSFDYSGHWDTEPDLLKRTCRYVDIGFCSCGHLTDEKAVWEALERIRDMGIQLVIGTMGDKGAFLLEGNKRFRQPAYYVQPVDTLGAGDSFVTGFLVSYIRSKYMDIENALKKGALFSSLICSVNGAFGYGRHFEYEG